VLLIVGTEVDPADLGPVPANVHVERWVPQSTGMAHTAAMVGHGGSGSTPAAMAAGMPLAVVPLFAEAMAAPGSRSRAWARSPHVRRDHVLRSAAVS
jgi:UDP:flavonoid glycosyltransferase YjiC (YdhE family)